jgi:glycosyltransferase involved in cell wall biosynthesis
MFRQSKRPDLLIEIARKAPDVRFIVCGGPTTFTAAPGYGEEIARVLRTLPNVEYRGQVAPDEALQVITDAALFLSTSDEEGFPNTFLHAWTAGTPVVSLRVDPDHVVERYRLGKLSRTVQQAISDMRMLLDSAQERQTISYRTREYVAENHCASAVIRIFERSTRGVSHKVAVQNHSGPSL